MDAAHRQRLFTSLLPSQVMPLSMLHKFEVLPKHEVGAADVAAQTKAHSCKKGSSRAQDVLPANLLEELTNTSTRPSCAYSWFISQNWCVLARAYRRR